jgi:ClpP class serine protease
VKGTFSAPYKRNGILAIDPRAFFDVFSVPDSRANTLTSNVAVVDIRGPLHTHDDGWCDSYEAVRARVTEACESAAPIVVMRIDSPGGDAAGCFDAARAIRASARAANKLLMAFVEGKACSASYALAAAADTIVLGQSGIVGSIGIISTRADMSEMNAARGLRVSLITSGARKADGNPDQPITESELKATQALVDSMAQVFFELIAELRGMDAESVAALQAGVFHGAGAVSVGLADRVQSFDEMLAAFASGGTTTMASSYDKAKAALEEAAKGDDANASAAKRALAAMEDQKPAEAADDAEDPDAEGDEEKPAAAEGGEPDGDEKPKPPAEDAKAANSLAMQALAEVHKMKAERAAEKLSAERKELLASRPDFSPEFLAVLKTADMSTVRKFVKDLPVVEGSEKPKAKLGAAAAAVTPAATRGEGMRPAGDSPVAAVNEMDRAMGLVDTKLACRREGNALVFGIAEVTRTAPAATPVAGVSK